MSNVHDFSLKNEKKKKKKKKKKTHVGAGSELYLEIPSNHHAPGKNMQSE